MIPTNEKERERIRKQLRKVGNDFLQAVKGEVDSCVLFCDVDRLERLISIVYIHMEKEKRRK